MIERHFDEELSNLKRKLLKMAEVVENMIEWSIEGLKQRKEELLNNVLEEENQVNTFQMEIDDLALKLIALRQPAASDLRLIISAIKINAELERMGDQAVNIVERSLDLIKEPPLKPLIDLPRMAEITQEMVKNSIRSFVEVDSSLARNICRQDDQVDAFNVQIFRELLTYMMQDPSNITRALELMLVGRHLERIADHATNICEDVVYLVEGKDVRHHIEEKE